MFKKWMEKSKKDQRGLTLVELLAVVVILAIVAAIAFVLIGNVIENSKKDAHIANAQQIISAVKLAESSGDIDSTALTNGVDILATETKLNTIGSPVDPWDKEEYASATVKVENEEYKITLTLKNTENDKCSITNTSEAKLQQGRKAVCK